MKKETLQDEFGLLSSRGSVLKDWTMNFFAEYGGLNGCSPHRFMCLNAQPRESDTIRRCGLIEVCVALLEEVCHYRSSFEVLYILKLCQCDTQSPAAFVIKM